MGIHNHKYQGMKTKSLRIGFLIPITIAAPRES